MIFAKRLKGKAIAAWLGPAGDAARKAVATVKQQIDKSPKRLDVYLDAADAWSYLTAQAATRLIEAYPVDIAVHIVTPPATDVNAHPAMRAKHAVRDAEQLAEYWDVDFTAKKEADPGSVRDVNSSLIRERPAREQLRCALELMGALWANDKKALTKLLGVWGTESTGSIAPILNTNYAALRKAGHYQGAMIAYGGEWFWGVDRLSHLEAMLAKDFGTDVAHVVTQRPESDRGPLALSTKPLTCEMWISYRSPYSYIALMQIEKLLAPFDVQLVLRPMFPMVMRGVQLPNVKRMYIIRDAKREAERQGIPFGQICDPLGAGIDNLIALSYWAEKQGALTAFAKSASQGCWSEARDASEYVDLRFLVERAGLDWTAAREALGDPEAPKWANANAADLAVIGLWGVPSFRCGDFVAWGQDRLPLLVDRLRRHQLQAASQNPS